MQEKVKLALRRSSSGLDLEITDTISACYKDLYRAGIAVYNSDGKTVKTAIEKDPLIIQCQKLYARWQFNFENQADRYEKAYTKCRDSLALCGDYNA